MPHHSKRAQRHHHLDGAGAYAPTSSGNLRSQQSFPPQEARSTMNYMNRTSVVSESSASCQNVGVHRLQYRPGDVQLQTTSSHTHWNGTKNSLVESVSSYDQVSPSSPESTCSKKVFGTSDLALSKDDSDVATIVRSPSREIASVLLLSLAATSGKTLTMPDASSSLKAETDRAHLSACNDESERTHSTGNKSSYPLKKRKVMEDVALKESDNGLDHTDGVCHISPISHGSKSSRVSDTAPEVDGQSFSGNDSISRTSVAQSYQFKEDSSTKTVDELKRGDSGRILPSNVMIPHFPEALHWLLTESSTQSVSAASSSEFIVDHSVMQWVTHGQAFRIIRWDSFHRNVLPAYFPQLSIEIDGRSVTAGSLDTFMWHLNAWGFEEIKDGPDVGAFAHTLFRRGHPHLCCDMRFLPASSISKSPSSSSVDSHSILRVPSLNSSSGVSDGRHAEMSEREEDSLTESTRNRSHLPESKGPPHRRNSYSSRYQSAVWATSPSGGGRVYQGPPGFVNYIPEEMNLTSDGWQLASAQNLPSQGTWIISQNSTSSPPQQHGMPPYSPIRIRSARGGTRRLPVSGSSSTSTPHVTSQSEASPSRSFPVSNRGMGRCRNVATTLPVKGNASSNDEVVMLAKPDASTVCSTMDLTAVKRDKRPEVKLPRSVVQRKLPLMSGTAADLPRS